MTIEESFENSLGGSTKLSPSGFFNYVFIKLMFIIQDIPAA